MPGGVCAFMTALQSWCTIGVRDSEFRGNSVQQAISLPSQPVRKPNHQRVKPEELGRLAELLAAKLKAGLSVGQALYALSVESKHPGVVAACKGVKAGLDKGRSLGEALRDYPDTFDEISVAMLAAGEKSNRLATELQRLSAYLSTTAKIAHELRSATTRPVVILGGGLLTVLVGLVAAAPVVEPFLRGLPEKEWPLAAHLTILVLHGARAILPVVLVAAALAYVGLRLLLRGEKGRLLRDGMLLQAPIIGSLWRAKAVAHFTRTTGVLVAAGIPAPNAMESAAITGDNAAVRGAVFLAMDKLSKGRDLPNALAEVGLAARAEINAMQAAERRGTLGEMLMKHAETGDADLLKHISRVKTVAQSATILVLGLLIAGALLGIAGPMLGLH
jgi:type II secretory pathway component PulF